MNDVIAASAGAGVTRAFEANDSPWSIEKVAYISYCDVVAVFRVSNPHG